MNMVIDLGLREQTSIFWQKEAKIPKKSSVCFSAVGNNGTEVNFNSTDFGKRNNNKKQRFHI